MTDTQLTKQPAPKKASALATMGKRLNVDPQKLMETLKATVFKGASDHEFVALVVVANELGLNPLAKQIYAFKKKSGGIEPMVPIDGWLKIINEHPQFDGLTVEEMNDEDGKFFACQATIYRKDRKHPIIIREYLSECTRPTEPWKTMPRRMLRNKAIIQCGRVAFALGGIHDEDEARDIAEREATGRVVSDFDPMANLQPTKAPEPETLELTNELTLDEMILAKAKKQGVPVEALYVEAAEAGAVKEKHLHEYTDEEKRIVLG